MIFQGFPIKNNSALKIFQFGNGVFEGFNLLPLYPETIQSLNIKSSWNTKSSATRPPLKQWITKLSYFCLTQDLQNNTLCLTILRKSIRHRLSSTGEYRENSKGGRTLENFLLIWLYGVYTLNPKVNWNRKGKRRNFLIAPKN